jgi:hypothetical protein
VRHIRLCSRIQAPHHLRAAVVASLLIFGCVDKTEDTSGGSGSGDFDVYDGPPVSFEEALTEVLVPSCGFDSCHGSGAGYFRVHENQTEEEYLELMSTVLITRQMVIPGNAATSYLIKKMEGSTDIDGQAMPPPDGGLSGYRIGIVRSWIDNIDAR